MADADLIVLANEIISHQTALDALYAEAEAIGVDPNPVTVDATRAALHASAARLGPMKPVTPAAIAAKARAAWAVASEGEPDGPYPDNDCLRLMVALTRDLARA